MKKNSKKRVLLSSVAMLMVGAVSLGTATYAWFTQSTVATTKNLGVRTAKSSSLQISGATAPWGTSVDYQFADKLLIPASSANGTKWFTADAASETDPAFKAGTASEITLTSGKNTTYFFKDQLNVRNYGAAAVENVKIKFSLPNGADYDYVRVALVETDDKGVNVASTGTFANCVYANDTELYKAVSGIEGTGTAQTIKTTDITPADNGEIEIPVATKLDAFVSESDFSAKYYNLYVWFEGQDPDCYNTNAGVSIPNIEFTVEGTTAAQS